MKNNNNSCSIYSFVRCSMISSCDHLNIRSIKPILISHHSNTMTTLDRTPTIVYIGATDSSGGAGLSANIKTTAAFGLHAAIVTTAVTNQTFAKCIESQRVDPFFVGRQLRTVLDEFNVHAIVTEMMYDSEIITECCQVIEQYMSHNRNVLLIVNPVMDVEDQGEVFLKRDAISSMIRLAKLADIVSVDVAEANRLLSHFGHEHRIRDLKHLEEAAKILQEELNVRYCVLKGDMIGLDELVGELQERADLASCFDVIVERGVHGVLKSPFVSSTCKHGDQDTFDSALACTLVLDFDGKLDKNSSSRAVEMSCIRARRFVSESIKHGQIPVMKGDAGTLNQLWNRKMESSHPHSSFA